MITPSSPDLQSQPCKMPGGIVGISGAVPCLISCKCPFVLLQYLTAPHSKSLLNLGWNFISALWSWALSLKTKTFNCSEDMNRNKEQPVTKAVTVSLDYWECGFHRAPTHAWLWINSSAVSLPCWDFSLRNELWDCRKASSWQLPSPKSAYSPWQTWTGPFFPKESVSPLHTWQ